MVVAGGEGGVATDGRYRRPSPLARPGCRWPTLRRSAPVLTASPMVRRSLRSQVTWGGRPRPSPRGGEERRTGALPRVQRSPACRPLRSPAEGGKAGSQTDAAGGGEGLAGGAPVIRADRPAFAARAPEHGYGYNQLCHRHDPSRGRSISSCARSPGPARNSSSTSRA